MRSELYCDFSLRPTTINYFSFADVVDGILEAMDENSDYAVAGTTVGVSAFALGGGGGFSSYRIKKGMIQWPLSLSKTRHGVETHSHSIMGATIRSYRHPCDVDYLFGENQCNSDGRRTNRIDDCFDGSGVYG
jgi:hypothetical protein